MSTVSTVNQGNSIKRSELQSHIREFQTKLGSNWDKYHESLSLFLIGRLSRNELMENIKPFLKNGLTKYHNKLLLLNFANALKDGPMDFQNEFASFWNKKSNKSKNVNSTQYEKFKQNIMGLPIKERRRIKNITRESGKKGKLNASITLTRHALLPKIPMIQDKDQQQLQVNNLVQWQQDVVNGINVPIATNNFELPDNENLSKRILMTMREYGLTGGLNSQILDVVMLGLETYLKNIVESSIDIVRYRENKYANNNFIPIETAQSTEKNLKKRPNESHDDKKPKKSKITLSIEDLYDTFEMYPYMIEYSGPKLRLPTVMLENDDMISHDLFSEFESEREFCKVNQKKNLTNDSENFSNGVIKKENEENNSPGPDSLSQKPVSSHEHRTGSSQRSENLVGSSDELKCVLYDLISTI